MVGAFTFQVLTRRQLGSDLWRAYTALRDARPIYDNPFFDPEFAAIVADVRADTRFGLAFEHGDLVGVWPMHVRPGDWARPIGAPFSDAHGPILSADCGLTEEAFLAGLGLAGFTGSGLLPQSWSAARPGLERHGAHLSDLSLGWDVFLAEQQRAWPKHFKKMRRLHRNVDRDFSELRFAWDDHTQLSFDTLIELKQRQFERTGLHDVLKPDWTRAMLDRLRQHEGRRLRLRTVVLRYDDEIAAVEVNLQSDRVLHGWLTAFEPRFAAYSPGNMLVQEMLQRLPEGGLTHYDAGIGLDHYKRHYCNLQQPLDVGVLCASRQSSGALRRAGAFWRQGEQVLPDLISGAMARVRRRVDQIAAAELSAPARMRGLMSALARRHI
ncbi:MAG: GNAT family N-acetyltransferase [Henriciella sp.]|nr:GNAT family N-acetyltransferase [Henriciella sp.]